MRYAWHMQTSYFGEKKVGLKNWAQNRLLAHIRDWDQRTAAHVTHFVAISRTVQQRIHECYGRPSKVIYPPVDTDYYHPAPVPRENYYLMVSAFAPYKRLDLAITACKRMGLKLVVIGKGQDDRKLRALAGPTVRFLGWQPDDVIRDHLRRCRALLFPGEEDFGIVPVEANACGAPVIAFGRGGATETVIPPEQGPEPTGLWFPEQTVEALMDALYRFEQMGRHFHPAAIRRQALLFHGERFAEEIFGYIDEVLRGPVRQQKHAA
jgi:glycosyltransferase involved in cell wall biosynthesis